MIPEKAAFDYVIRPSGINIPETERSSKKVESTVQSRIQRKLAGKR